MSEFVRATGDRIRALFSDADVAEAERLIATFVRDVIRGGSQRIEFAAVRYSAGDLARLREAIELGRADWRDLLVAADFADDLHAHERWLPRRLDTQIIDIWRSGVLPQGVSFRLNETVRLVSGPILGLGAVISLVALEPQPRYAVELASGRDVEAWQRWLKTVQTR
jgi:hypothetical protein